MRDTTLRVRIRHAPSYTTCRLLSQRGGAATPRPRCFVRSSTSATRIRIGTDLRVRPRVVCLRRAHDLRRSCRDTAKVDPHRPLGGSRLHVPFKRRVVPPISPMQHDYGPSAQRRAVFEGPSLRRPKRRGVRGQTASVRATVRCSLPGASWRLGPLKTTCAGTGHTQYQHDKWMRRVKNDPCALSNATCRHAYSMGVRQAIWRARLWDHADVRLVSAGVDDYMSAVPRARFCLHTEGNGWGIRLVDYAVMGCVPLIVNDRMLQVFEQVLPYDRFGPRIHATFRGSCRVFVANDTTHAAGAPRFVSTVVCSCGFIPTAWRRGDNRVHWACTQIVKLHPNVRNTSGSQSNVCVRARTTEVRRRGRVVYTPRSPPTRCSDRPRRRDRRPWAGIYSSVRARCTATARARRLPTKVARCAARHDDDRAIAQPPADLP